MSQSWEPGDLPPADAQHYQAWPPVGDQRAPRSGRRMVALVAAVLVGSLALSALCAAGLMKTVRSQDPDLSQPVPLITRPEVSPSLFDGHYRPPQDLCKQSDFTPLWKAFIDPDPEKKPKVWGVGSDVDRATSCPGTLEREHVFRADFLLTVSVYPDDQAGMAAFVAGRGDAAVTKLVIPGQPDGYSVAAYSYDAPGDVIGVRLYDHNLLLEMTWHWTGSAPPERDAVLNALYGVCASTFRLMRFN